MYRTLWVLLSLTLLHLTTIICDQLLSGPNEILFIDLRLQDNSKAHHTEKYKQIVFRRGEDVTFSLRLAKPYNNTTDLLQLNFSFGSNPRSDKGTLIQVPVLESVSSKTTWHASITKSLDSDVLIQFYLPADIAVGAWRLTISTIFQGSTRIRSYPLREPIYVVFNPWSNQDPVYITSPEERQEYVLNEIGKIYMGTYIRPTGRTWVYGQFHETVLPTILSLLDRSRLDVTGRADAVKVGRTLSALVNNHDDNGLLEGKWEGNYAGGVSPWQWSSSPPIFDRFLSTGGRPVKFAQCWVFAGALTTALRTLGIPARSVSTFVAAHDTDMSLTLDKFYDQWGRELKSVNRDTTWNFHVWSEAWMERYDLPPGYGGWQVLDSTPQETSERVFQLGPASVEAVKQGRVDFAYDTAFVFSEVNADYIHWQLDGYNRWRRTKQETDHIGRRVLTKKVQYLDTWSAYKTNDAVDITANYKHPEGSQVERLAYNQAARLAGLGHKM